MYYSYWLYLICYVKWLGKLLSKLLYAHQNLEKTYLWIPYNSCASICTKLIDSYILKKLTLLCICSIRCNLCKYHISLFKLRSNEWEPARWIEFEWIWDSCGQNHTLDSDHQQYSIPWRSLYNTDPTNTKFWHSSPCRRCRPLYLMRWLLHPYDVL